MHTNRRNKVTITALAAAALLLLGSCTMSSKGAAPEDSAISVPTGSGSEPPTSAGADPAADGSGRSGSPRSDDEADAQMLRDTGSWAAGADLCTALAKGPWETVAYESDPVDLIEAGTVPPGLDRGLDAEPDETHEWTDVSQYEDPSTLDDPGGVADAMEQAGFDAGAEARWHNGHEEAVITAVRFRDAEGAQAVLSTLATDYCTRAVSARALPDGTGIDIVRDSGATRVLAVVDDTVISLWACSCISSRSQDGISDWHDQFRDLIAEPAPDTTTS